MCILITAKEPRIYISTNIKVLLQPRKLKYTNLNNFAVVDLVAYWFILSVVLLDS